MDMSLLLLLFLVWSCACERLFVCTYVLFRLFILYPFNFWSNLGRFIVTKNDYDDERRKNHAGKETGFADEKKARFSRPEVPRYLPYFRPPFWTTKKSYDKKHFNLVSRSSLRSGIKWTRMRRDYSSMVFQWRESFFAPAAGGEMLNGNKVGQVSIEPRRSFTMIQPRVVSIDLKAHQRIKARIRGEKKKQAGCHSAPGTRVQIGKTLEIVIDCAPGEDKWVFQSWM